MDIFCWRRHSCYRFVKISIVPSFQLQSAPKICVVHMNNVSLRQSSLIHYYLSTYCLLDFPGSKIDNDKDCFIYPDLKTCLMGKFNEKSRAVKARQARIVGLCEEKVKIISTF